jgi:hypothetical protein
LESDGDATGKVTADTQGSNESESIDESKEDSDVKDSKSGDATLSDEEGHSDEEGDSENYVDDGWGQESSDSMDSDSGDIDYEGPFGSEELEFVNGGNDKSSLGSSMESSEEDIDAIDQVHGGDGDIFSEGIDKTVDLQQADGITQQEEDWFDDTDPAGSMTFVLVLLVGFAVLYFMWQRRRPVADSNNRRAGYTPIHSRGKSK